MPLREHGEQLGLTLSIGEETNVCRYANIEQHA
jgi:hypothetical protein